MYGQYLRLLQAQRQGSHGSSARDAAFWLAVVCMIASAAFWFPIQWKLTTPQTIDETVIAASMGLFMVAGPPIIVSMWVPWSRVGRLLQRLQLTWLGQILGTGAGVFLIYYAYQLTLSFWASRPVIANANLSMIQTIVGLIATILVPALLWAPGSQEELAEKMRLDQQITNYEEASRARIRLIRQQELRALQLAKIGFANLVAGEREELAGYMLGLVKSIDRTITEIANDAAETAGVAGRYASMLEGDQDVAATLDYVSQSLLESANYGHAQPLQPSAITVNDGATTVISRPEPANGYTASERVTNGYGSNPSNGPSQAEPVPARELTMTEQTALGIARERLGRGAWTAKDLAEVLRIEPDTARTYIAYWRQHQFVTGEGLSRGRYIFTEGGR